MTEQFADLITFFKRGIFLFNTIIIIGHELFLYYIYRDYSMFISRFTDRLATINILYVKLFQAIALNNDFIDNKINEKLLTYTDNVPWTYNEIPIRDIIDMSDKYDIDLRNGYTRPINSGMISLVFKAYKRGSTRDREETVIIKVKRNNIETRLHEAILNVQMLLYLLSFIPIFHVLNFVEAFNTNIASIQGQTNFAQEVDNINKIKENSANLKYIVVPSVYKEVTENYPNIILMDYISGIKINEIQKEDYDGFAKQVVKFGFVSSFIHGVTHGDLHSGNILFIKDTEDIKYPYKIGIVDFGIIYEIDTTFRETMFDIVTNMFTLPARETAVKLLNSGIIEPPNIIQLISNQHYVNIVDFTEKIIHETIDKTNQIQIYKFLYNLKDYLSNAQLADVGIKPSEVFMKTQLTLAMSHGITIQLCNGDFLDFANSVINELFHTDIFIQ